MSDEKKPSHLITKTPVKGPRGFRPRVRTRVQKLFHKPSRTKQNDLTAADINVIVKKYGGIPVNPRVAPMYGDISQIPDYAQALQIVIDGQNAFDSLPSNVRARFQNDPSEYVKFISDPKNIKEAESLGLVTIRPPVAPDDSKESSADKRSASGKKTEPVD